MSNTEPTTAHAVNPGDDQHLTVEDTGSTTDAGELVGEDAVRTSSSSSSSGSDPDTGGLGSLAGDDSIGHVFDQTNGVVEGAEGDSDGTADGELFSPAERGANNSALDSSEPLGGDENA
jgi:hypothetical protein